MPKLADRTCLPCHGGTERLDPTQIRRLAAELHESWQVVDQHHLARRLTFPDFASGLAFVNRVGALAEAEGHHPDLSLAWGRVDVVLFTHAVNGLSEADFILAAKVDALVAESRAVDSRAVEPTGRLTT